MRKKALNRKEFEARKVEEVINNEASKLIYIWLS